MTKWNRCLAGISGIALIVLGGACQKIDKQGTGVKAPPKDRPVLEFYVMSQCPYGVQVVQGVTPALEQLGDAVDFKLEFIGDIQGENLTAMHGPSEVKGNMVQLCAKKQAPDKYLKMISCQNKNMKQVDTNWESCGKEAGMDTAKLKGCLDGPEGKQLLTASYQAAKAKGASGSPTMYLNGKEYQGGRKAGDFMRAICDAIPADKPAACSSIPEAPKVNAFFLTDSRCAKCDISGLEGQLKGAVAGLQAKKYDYNTPEGKKFYDDMQAKDASFKLLPAIIFDSSVEKDTDAMQNLGNYLRPLGDMKTLHVGGSFDPKAEICDNTTDDDGNGQADCADATCKESIVCRTETKGTLDLFVMSQCPYGAQAMIAAKEVTDALGNKIKVDVHFIGDVQNGQLTGMHGQSEVDENIRELCAVKKYPKNHKFMEYLACRSKDYRNTNWQACTGSNGIDAKVIQTCFDKEGKDLLTKDYAIAKALDIGASPTLLANNKYIFNGVAAEPIKAGFCMHNPGTPGCEKTLSGSAPPAGGGGAPAGGACGN